MQLPASERETRKAGILICMFRPRATEGNLIEKRENGMMELDFHVDDSKCIRCGACIRDCVSAILFFDPDSGYPRVMPGAESRCTRCQHCLAVCPRAAIQIFGRDPEKSLSGCELPDADKILRLIANRRSFRSYRHENLDRATLDKLKEMLRFVPTGVNAHSLHFAFIDEVEVMDSFRNALMERIAELFRENPSHPFLIRTARYRSQLMEGRDVIFRGAPHLVVAAAKADSPCPAYDPVIALSYFELYARSLGIGTVWCGLALQAFNDFPDLMARLKLPEGYIAVCCMLFGPTSLHYPRATQPDPVGMHSVE